MILCNGWWIGGLYEENIDGGTKKRTIAPMALPLLPRRPETRISLAVSLRMSGLSMSRDRSNVSVGLSGQTVCFTDLAPFYHSALHGFPEGVDVLVYKILDFRVCDAGYGDV